MKLRQVLAMYAVVGLMTLLGAAAVTGGSVWLIVKVLRWMGVLG